MTETLVGSPAKKTLTPQEAEHAAMRELVEGARAKGDDLTGPDGLLKSITKQVIEAALEEETSEHVGYDKHAVRAATAANSRNGIRAKTVLTDNAGPVEVEIPAGVLHHGQAHPVDGDRGTIRGVRGDYRAIDSEPRRVGARGGSNVTWWINRNTATRAPRTGWSVRASAS